MKCKLCHTDKPTPEFDQGPNGKPISWCKACRALCERALRGYTRWAPRPRDTWPDSLLNDVSSIKHHVAAGGTPYRRQKVEVMLRHCDWQPESTESVEVSAEAFMYLMDRVEELERLIATRSHLGMGNADERDAQARRFTDAVNKLDIPQLTREDLASYRDALRRMYTEVVGDGYISPRTMRDLVAPLELCSAPMPLELVRIYNSLILPSLDRAKEAEEYPRLVDEALELLGGVNYYEVDWLDIPIGESVEEGIF